MTSDLAAAISPADRAQLVAAGDAAIEAHNSEALEELASALSGSTGLARLVGCWQSAGGVLHLRVAHDGGDVQLVLGLAEPDEAGWTLMAVSAAGGSGRVLRIGPVPGGGVDLRMELGAAGGSAELGTGRAAPHTITAASLTVVGA